MTSERPMFPPAAESVHAFYPQPAIEQPESQTLTGDSPEASGHVLQFPTLAEAESWLQAQGFRLVPDSCNWTNDDGDDAGVYSIGGIWGEVKAWRVEINRRSSKPAGGLSRRLMLAGLAMLPAVLPAAAAAPDPAFALIAAHRAAEVAHCEVIDAQAEAETKYGIRSDEAWEAADRSGAMCDEVNAIAWRLATTPPTTFAGVAAVLRFANEVEDAGGDWPDTDTIGREGWHYQLRATTAQAIEAIIRQAAGGLA